MDAACALAAQAVLRRQPPCVPQNWGPCMDSRKACGLYAGAVFPRKQCPGTGRGDGCIGFDSIAEVGSGTEEKIAFRE